MRLAPPAPELLFGAAVAIVLVAIGLRAGGGLSLGPTTKLEIALDLGGGLVAAAALLAATGKRAWGLGTLSVFALVAVLTGVSIAWAVQPSDAWLETNRTIAYVAVFTVGLLVARQAGTWWPPFLGGILTATAVICGYAVLTKIFPGWLATDEVYARLREPYGYWNAVGLTAALGVPAAMWLGARRHGHGVVNALAYPAMGLLLLTMLLAYSRGSLLAVAIGCAFWFIAVPLRLRGVAVLGGGAVGALLVSTWAFGAPALSEDQVGLTARIIAGRQLGAATLAMLLCLLLLGLALGFLTTQRAPAVPTRRRVGTALVVLLALIPVGLVAQLALSDRGLGGSLSDGWRSLTDPNDRTPLANDPSRLTKVGSVRARYWHEAYEIWRAHKVAGVGAGGYATARPRFRDDTLAVRHAHGYIVQTAADFGIVGLLLTIALLGAWLVAACRTCSLRLNPFRPRRGPPPATTPERVGLLTLMTIALVFGVHSFIDWTWYVPGVAVIGLACAGWVAGRGPASEPPQDPRTYGRRAAAGLRNPVRTGAAILALGVAGIAAWTAWQPLHAVHVGNDALAELDRAGTDPQALARARELTEQARDINPLSVEPLFERYVVETLAGRKDVARRALEEAVRLQPSNPATWLSLTRFALDQEDDPKLALRLLGPALYLDPKSPSGAQIYLEATRRAQEQQAERQAAIEQRRQERRERRERRERARERRERQRSGG